MKIPNSSPRYHRSSHHCLDFPSMVFHSALGLNFQPSSAPVPSEAKKLAAGNGGISSYIIVGNHDYNVSNEFS